MERRGVPEPHPLTPGNRRDNKEVTSFPSRPAGDGGQGLTTGQSPFIEQARAAGLRYIEQPYALYSQSNHDAWRRLYERQEESWRRYANRHFLRGLETLRLDPCRVPRLSEVNQFLSPRTGFVAKPVAGYVPAYAFFDCLRQRAFPTTITIRDAERLDYLPEPDIFPADKKAG